MKKHYYAIMIVILTTFVILLSWLVNQSLNETNSQIKALTDELKAIKQEIKTTEPVFVSPAKHTTITSRNLYNILSKNKLPSNPTEKDVDQYLTKIYFTSQSQNCFTPDDIQIRMIEKVGHKFLPLVIRKTQQFSSRSYHFENALKNMVREEDKKLVLKNLYLLPALINPVVKFGWEKDAKKVIFSKLKSYSYLPEKWIICAVQLATPKDKNELLNYFKYAPNKRSTYKALKSSSKFKLDKTVAEIWNQKMANSDWDRNQISQIAADFGHIDALKDLIFQLNSQSNYTKEQASKQLYRLTEQCGSFADMIKWFKANEKKLYFDKAKGKYLIRSPKTKK